MTDRFEAKLTNLGWRVVRYFTEGDGPPQHIVMGEKFRKQETAERRAYQLQVLHERRMDRYHRPYLGD